MSLPTLDMMQQLTHERRALHILALPAMQQKRSRVAERFRANWLAGTPDGAARLENAVGRYAMLATQFALLDDPARPAFAWSCNLPHEWHGIAWPGAGWGLDNPDNFYRYLFVDGASRYEITGHRTGPGPV